MSALFCLSFLQLLACSPLFPCCSVAPEDSQANKVPGARTVKIGAGNTHKRPVNARTASEAGLTDDTSNKGSKNSDDMDAF